MRTPFLSMEMTTLSSPLPFGASMRTPDLSIFTSGSVFDEGGSGGAGNAAFGGVGGSGSVSITSVIDHLNGGMFDSRLIAIMNNTASTRKRFQLMPTSQFAYR